jgi:predicted peroxiredoxin
MKNIIVQSCIKNGVEFYLCKNEEYYSRFSLARSINIDEICVRYLFNKKFNIDHDLYTFNGKQVAKMYGRQKTLPIVSYLNTKGKVPSNVIEHFNLHHHKKLCTKSPEKEATSKFIKTAKLWGCKTEVVCASGKVDIVTLTEVIEVKSYNAWKSAIGQALVYSLDLGLRGDKMV